MLPTETNMRTIGRTVIKESTLWMAFQQQVWSSA